MENGPAPDRADLRLLQPWHRFRSRRCSERDVSDRKAGARWSVIAALVISDERQESIRGAGVT
jgi:hypothetical protein